MWKVPSIGTWRQTGFVRDAATCNGHAKGFARRNARLDANLLDLGFWSEAAKPAKPEAAASRSCQPVAWTSVNLANCTTAPETSSVAVASVGMLRAICPTVLNCSSTALAITLENRVLFLMTARSSTMASAVSVVTRCEIYFDPDVFTSGAVFWARFSTSLARQQRQNRAARLARSAPRSRHSKQGGWCAAIAKV